MQAKQRKVEYQKRDYTKHREKRLFGQWSFWIRSQYGLTPKQYQQLLRQQNYRCAICRILATRLEKRLSIDHNHKTGKVRGLLCPKCNRGIGLFNDNPKYLRKASEYLVNAK